jgi:hypothetical protein
MEGASPPVDAVQSTATPMAAAPADPQEQNVDAGPQNLAVKSNAEAGSKVDSKGLDGSAPAVVKRVQISGEQREKVVQAAKEAERRPVRKFRPVAVSSDNAPYSDLGPGLCGPQSR